MSIPTREAASSDAWQLRINSEVETVRVGTWNVAWKHPSRSAGRTMRERLLAEDPEVLCITEPSADFMGDTGHTICAEADYGYPV